MLTQNKAVDLVIAHRGLQAHFPENSALAIKGALEAGVRQIELDVQFSRDGEPVLFHDNNLKRVCKQKIEVSSLNLDELMQMSAYEPKRFKRDFIANTIEPLSAILPFFEQYPDVYFFIELKDGAIEHYGEDYCLAKIAMVLAPYLDRLTLIAFNHSAICKAKASFHFQKTGLVLSSLKSCWQRCCSGNVDIAFINVKRLSTKSLPKLPCALAVYEIADVDAARHWLNLGVDKVESFSSDILLSGLP